MGYDHQERHAFGTGALGSLIAIQNAYSGFAVTAYDINDEVLEGAEGHFHGLASAAKQEVESADGGPARRELEPLPTHPT